MGKKIFLAIAIFLLLAVLVFLWWSRNTVEAHEFAGRIEKIEGREILMTGFFVVEGRPDLASKGQEQRVRIIVSDQTEFIKETIYLPGPEEIKNPNGTFRVDDLKKDSRKVSFDDLKKDLARDETGLRVYSSDNIFGRTKFEASRISYRLPIMPSQR